MIDITISLVLLLSVPFTIWRIAQPGRFISNLLLVLFGRYSWVGYASGVPTSQLPPLKTGVLPPYNLLRDYEPSELVKMQINKGYAQNYAVLNDVSIVWNNLHYAGKQPGRKN